MVRGLVQQEVVLPCNDNRVHDIVWSPSVPKIPSTIGLKRVIAVTATVVTLKCKRTELTTSQVVKSDTAKTLVLAMALLLFGTPNKSRCLVTTVAVVVTSSTASPTTL